MTDNENELYDDYDELSQEEIRDAEVILTRASQMMIEFNSLVKKGTYQDNSEDFQKFVSIEWDMEDRLEKKRKEQLRMKGV